VVRVSLSPSIGALFLYIRGRFLLCNSYFSVQLIKLVFMFRRKMCHAHRFPRMISSLCYVHAHVSSSKCNQCIQCPHNLAHLVHLRTYLALSFIILWQ
jgi:hypothetical protein